MSLTIELMYEFVRGRFVTDGDVNWSITSVCKYSIRVDCLSDQVVGFCDKGI